MSDLGDWMWLGVVVLWLAARVLPRLFRNNKPETSAPKPPAKLPADRKSGHQVEFGHKPLEPK